VHIALWYRMIAVDAETIRMVAVEKQLPEETKKWGDVAIRNVDRWVEWAHKAVDRSPETVKFHHFLGEAYWKRAELEPVDRARQLALYEESIAQFKLAAEGYPVEPQVWVDYGKRLKALGTAYTASNTSVSEQSRGRELLKERRNVMRHVKQLRKQRKICAQKSKG